MRQETRRDADHCGHCGPYGRLIYTPISSAGGRGCYPFRRGTCCPDVGAVVRAWNQPREHRHRSRLLDRQLIALALGCGIALVVSTLRDRRARRRDSGTAERVDTAVQVYFCDPQSPWQRGTNENTNGLLCQYLPHGMNLKDITQDQLNEIAAGAHYSTRRTHRALAAAAPLRAYRNQWTSNRCASDVTTDSAASATHTARPPGLDVVSGTHRRRFCLGRNKGCGSGTGCQKFL